MEGTKRRICSPLLLVLLACFFTQLVASSDEIFYESFSETFEGRWITSEKDEYEGVWKRSKSQGHDDYGLLVSEKARKYAIVKVLDKPVDLKAGTVVLQYEVRLQLGLECGGAYIKYLRPQEAGWVPKGFDNESPYTIMFGPDRCGVTNKVHFILKHKNPNTGEFIEHHLKYPPAVPFDNFTHVYTAVLRPDNSFSILVDGEDGRKGNFIPGDEFDPPLVPAKTISDPNDKIPADWDEREKIPDPDEKKPEDWDDTQPFEILDDEAKKPEGWLDDEPKEVDDPEATKPEDWDDEEDGEWEPPKVPNPKCGEALGCGEWKRPFKKNPAYRGRWSASLIDNPNYKGVWKARDIPNPNYYELERPNFDPIAAIGIEIWTMQDGILFDNILIASSESVAESYRNNAWKPKFLAEKERHRVEEAASRSGPLKTIQKAVFGALYKIADIPFLSQHQIKIMDLIETAESQPNLTLGVIVGTAVIIFTILISLMCGGGNKQAAPRVAPPKVRQPKSSGNQSGSETEEPTETAGTVHRRRNSRREN